MWRGPQEYVAYESLTYHNSITYLCFPYIKKTIIEYELAAISKRIQQEKCHWTKFFFSRENE